MGSRKTSCSSGSGRSASGPGPSTLAKATGSRARTARKETGQPRGSEGEGPGQEQRRQTILQGLPPEEELPRPVREVTRLTQLGECPHRPRRDGDQRGWRVRGEEFLAPQPGPRRDESRERHPWTGATHTRTRKGETLTSSNYPLTKLGSTATPGGSAACSISLQTPRLTSPIPSTHAL